MGRHHLLVQAEGFLPLERDVLVTRGKVEDLGVLSLEPASVALILDVSPSNAFVVVGGADGNLGGKRYSGPWPREIAIPPGTYNIVAFGQGLSTSQQQVTLAPGREAAAVQFRLASSDIYE